MEGKKQNKKVERKNRVRRWEGELERKCNEKWSEKLERRENSK